MLGLLFGREHHPHDRVSVPSAVLVFSISGLAALAFVSLGMLWVIRRTATDEATTDATRVTEAVGHGVIAPALQDQLLDGDPAALAQLDQLVHQQVLDDDIVRVKLWKPNGTIVYSDEPQLVGRQFTLGDEELSALITGKPDADISDLTRPENSFEAHFGKLLEVYFPVRTPGGSPLLFEAYLSYNTISAGTNEVWRRFLPALLAGLLVLEVTQVPLALSLARRLRRGQDERESLLQRTLQASDRERRQIASELHDGPVQDLIGHSYQLAAIAEKLNGSAPDMTDQLLHASAQARGSVKALRSLLVDLYPANLRSEGLRAALADLVLPLQAQGTAVSLDVDDCELSEEVERLIYRAAREALRNAHDHAQASAVAVRIARGDRSVILHVTDNGKGFDPATRDTRRAEGHVGLDLLERLVHDAGGTFTLVAHPDEGTKLTVEVPVW